jgi:hypothetical protein
MTTVTQTHEYNTQSSEDFPVLGAMAPTKPKDASSGSGKKVFTKTFTISHDKLGFISRMDALKANRYSGGARGRVDDGKRAAAYEKLQDKEAMAKRLTKTRLCWSVQKGVPCPHGAGNCHFAHTKDELRMAPCLFGDRCRFVRWRRDEYCNNSDRKCQYLHPEESRENYMKRTGLDKIEPKALVKTKVADLVPIQVRIAKSWAAPRRRLGDDAVKANDEYIELLNKKNPCGKKAFNRDEQEPTEPTEPTEEVSSGEEEEDLERQLEELLEPETGEAEAASYTVPKAIAMETLKEALERGQTVITLTIV